MGCRNTRPEVPPERPYVMPGAATTAIIGPGSSAPHVGFSSEPPAGAYASSAGLPSSSAGSNIGSSTAFNGAPPTDLGLGPVSAGAPSSSPAAAGPYSGPAPAILGDPGIQPAAGFTDPR
jgi:hypothetical protein